MTQQNNQQNRQPHPNQAPRSQQTQVTNPVPPAPAVPSTDQQTLTITDTVKMQITKLDATPKKEDLKQVLSRLVTEVIFGKRHPEAARLELHTWYHSMTTEEQQAFKASRVQADETMNWFKGVVEILAQELPSLYVA